MMISWIKCNRFAESCKLPFRTHMVKMNFMLVMMPSLWYSKGMNKLPLAKRVQIIQMLWKGSSMRTVSRVVDVSINTVTKLLVEAGTACSEYQGKVFRILPCKRVQADEIWSFCYSKKKNIPKKMKNKEGVGDIWTWTAICADSKLIPSWFIGNRDLETAKIFIKDLAGRLANRVQLTTDGHRPYLEAVEDAFGSDVDYSQLIKIYGNPKGEEIRYSQGECCGTKTETITGRPDPDHISTSYVERANLTMRMCMRRFTRLTNGFSKKMENHGHAIALYFMFYNFVRIHKTLRVTPAMRAKVTDHLWSIEEVISLIK